MLARQFTFSSFIGNFDHLAIPKGSQRDPKGIQSFSPGLRGTSYPGISRQEHLFNSERVESSAKERQKQMNMIFHTANNDGLALEIRENTA